MSNQRLRTSLFLAAPDDEIFPSARQEEPSILAATKRAGHSLVAAAKRARFKGIVSAILMASGAFGAAPAADASIVTITVTGTVASGVDNTGVFGFGRLYDLSGHTFNLVYTFDDTKGTQSLGDSATGQACGTAITSAPTSNPGTAVLQIGTGTWTFGTLPGGGPLSTAARLIGNCRVDGIYNSSPNYSSGGPVWDIVSVDASDVSASNDDVSVLLGIAGAAIPTTNYNWEDSLPSTPPLNNDLYNSSGGFSIDILDANNNTVESASGKFMPTTLTVSGSSQAAAPAALQFIPVTPCRVADTRNAGGAFGGPELSAGTSREFDIPKSACSIPSSALAYSLNVTAVPNGPLGYLTLWPSGQTQPTVSTLNSDGRVKANAAIIPAGTNGGVSIFVTDSSHVILDIDGYFAPAGTASALAFYPVTPCRVADTRNASGPLGGPSLAAGSSRDFPLQSSSCALPSDAKAYSLNVTAVPKGALGYLTMWPSGQTQPLVSTLNSPTGAVTANAAIVPAGSNGDVSIFVSNASDVIVDVNGYFAAPAADGLSLYATTPCRVLDTRSAAGAFNGTLAVAVENSSCTPPSTAQAYVLNATVLPTASLGYLTLWPAGENQPVVSTLNAADGAVTSNMAIAPTVNGSIDAFSSNPTQLILDLSSYFAP
jgi:hypothetical protein